MYPTMHVLIRDASALVYTLELRAKPLFREIALVFSGCASAMSSVA
jgi:hypothetical protein